MLGHGVYLRIDKINKVSHRYDNRAALRSVELSIIYGKVLHCLELMNLEKLHYSIS